MLGAAREAGVLLRGGIRKMGDDAIVTMQKRRLQVIHVDVATLADWVKEAEASTRNCAAPKFRRSCSTRSENSATNTVLKPRER
jgi:hypothetical protein